MKPPMNVPQSVAGNMRVNLRGADIRVSEQFLDHPQVCSMFQQMRGEAVPEHVRRHVAAHTRPAHSPLDAQPKRHLCEWRAPFGQENVRR